MALDVNAKKGHVTFSAGTGAFRHFRADVAVTQDEDGLWHWDGTYRIVRSGGDD